VGEEVGVEERVAVHGLERVQVEAGEVAH